MEHRHRPVPPAPGGGRLVHLELVVELEQLGEPLAVEDQPVERRQQRGAAPERLVEPRELLRVDPPGAAHALDERRLPGIRDGAGLAAGHRGAAGAGDAERGEPSAVALGPGLLERHREEGRAAPGRRGPRAARGPRATTRRPRRAPPCSSAASARSSRCSSRSSATPRRRCRAARGPAADPRPAAGRGCRRGRRSWPRPSRRCPPASRAGAADPATRASRRRTAPGRRPRAACRRARPGAGRRPGRRGRRDGSATRAAPTAPGRRSAPRPR